MNTLKTFTNDTETSQLPYLLFSVGKNIYGISSEFVRSIETLGEITAIMEPEPNVRGGVIYQNNFIYLLDMRKLFSLDSQIEEFEKAVQPEQRIKDHENWVLALDKSVREHTEFTLTDDPHQCAFGRWYYSFKTDNNFLKHQLSEVEAPHEAIHNTAKLIKKLTKENNFEAALLTLDEMRATHYKATLRILSHLREIVVSNLKELYIIIDSTDYIKGIIVDSIIGVEYLDNTLEMPNSMRGTTYIEFLGQRKNDNSTVIVINNSI